MKNKLSPKDKIFECKPKCEFPKIEGIAFSCDKCIKQQLLLLTDKEKEEIRKLITIKPKK